MSQVTHGGSLLVASGKRLARLACPLVAQSRRVPESTQLPGTAGIRNLRLASPLRRCSTIVRSSAFYLFGPQLLRQTLRKHYKIRHGPFCGSPASKKTPLPPLQSKITRKTGETASEIQRDSIF